MCSPATSFFSAQARKFLLLFTLTWIPTLMYAQNHARLHTREILRKGTYYSRQTATVKPQKSYRVNPGFAFTSLSLRIDPSQTFEGAYIISEQDTFWLQQDEHQPVDDTLKQANLVIIEQPVQQVLFGPGLIRGKVIFSFMNAMTGQKGTLRQRKESQEPFGQAEGCSEPALIEQEVWREGLPAPEYQRATSVVQHVIVHHSAGSNTSTDYENVVRNIYLFHTMDRGWSDIGYNYLIAQDGTIFEGRSPGGQAVDRDNIRGAHFCGQNTGTMGICLLGNYETAVPTEASLASLIHLTAWKVNKENLNPFNKIPHAANPSLDVIAGHRNGCATACPGANLYARLEEIRLAVKDHVQTFCQTAFAIFPVPASHMLYITLPDAADVYEIFLYDLQGQSIAVPVSLEDDRWKMDVSLLAEGVYIIKVKGENFSEERKVILQHDS